MLVCVRELDKSELAKRHGKRISAPHYERYYSLYTNEASTITIVDVADNRARKTFNYDVSIRSPAELHEQVVEPLLMTVLAPDRASQAVVVVDGTAGNRFTTLMDPVDGVLATTARTAAAYPDVASISFSAVTLEDSNTLSDILLPDRSGGDATEVTILEDTEEQFTSVEDAHYVSLESERVWEAALQRITHAFADYKHQVYSFILSFHASTGRPNTTMQLISFTVNEVARGMKSTRHAVSSAAGLIECSSPTLTFTSTKLLYLLKPSLLGQQPGAWVACFSPVSVVEAAAAERESFQEAFAVAQTASRLYSSRIALLNASTFVLPQQAAPGSTVAFPEGQGAISDAEDQQYDDEPSSLSAPRVRPPRMTSEAQTETSDVRMKHPSTAHLVETPAGAGLRQRVEVGTSTPTASEQAAALTGRQQPQQQPEKRPTGVAAAVQTDAAAPASSSTSPPLRPRESIQRGASEEPSAVRYEFDTYRAVMERAMSKLRADMRHYAEQLDETKEEMRAHRRQSRELRRALEMADASRHATVLENSGLRQELAGQQRQYEQKLHELSTSSEAHRPPSQPGQVARQEESVATRALRDEVELLEVRVGELTELVAFHQSEIKDHVSREHMYRQRILDLEAALREKEREAITGRAAVQEARRAADTALSTVHRATPPPVAASSEPQHSRTSTTVLREDLHDVEDRAAEVECHLRTAMDELQRERTQRLQLEHLLKQRETEEVARSAEQKTEAVLRSAQQAYENQLRDLRQEMAGFRAQLEQQMTRASPSQPRPPSPKAAVLAASNDSSVQGPPPRMSPVPEAASNTSQSVNDAPRRSSRGGSARPSPSRPLRRTQSFEEYMKEEPHYELHRASFLRPRSRPVGADTSSNGAQ